MFHHVTSITQNVLIIFSEPNIRKSYKAGTLISPHLLQSLTVNVSYIFMYFLSYLLVLHRGNEIYCLFLSVYHSHTNAHTGPTGCVKAAPPVEQISHSSLAHPPLSLSFSLSYIVMNSAKLWTSGLQRRAAEQGVKPLPRCGEDDFRYWRQRQ